ncbi:hypothetical protein EMIHUDRAFT_124387, partial [Emiliania huxleyi CCMP1516]|uniref:Uncharacterized protein n=2 Tax=Emiliania huxleyi TaxID=2903 RepID=A0A0D3ISG3_EMIH1
MSLRPQQDLEEDPALAEALDTVPKNPSILKERNAQRAELTPDAAPPTRSEKNLPSGKAEDIPRKKLKSRTSPPLGISSGSAVVPPVHRPRSKLTGPAALPRRAPDQKLVSGATDKRAARDKEDAKLPAARQSGRPSPAARPASGGEDPSGGRGSAPLKARRSAGGATKVARPRPKPESADKALGANKAPKARGQTPKKPRPPPALPAPPLQPSANAAEGGEPDAADEAPTSGDGALGGADDGRQRPAPFDSDDLSKRAARLPPSLPPLIRGAFHTLRHA